MLSKCKRPNTSFEFSIPDDIALSADIEAAVMADLKMIDKEVKKDSENALDDTEDKSESEEESEDGEKNLHDRSFISEGYEFSVSSMASSDLHQSNSECESGLKKDLLNETKHSASNSPASDECDSSSTTEQISEKDELASNLQDSQNLIAEYEKEKDRLLGEIMALNLQLDSVTKEREEIQRELENFKVKVQSLEEQLSERMNAHQLSREEHTRNLEEMKLCHDKDILSNKEAIDKLLKELNSKTEEAESLYLIISQLRTEYQQLRIEKAELICKLSEAVLNRKEYIQYLESDINCLKRELQRLKTEKEITDQENSLLKMGFLRRWARSLFLWQLHYLQKVCERISIPFF